MNEKNMPLRWGIIGCGAVTEIKSGPAYQRTDGFKVVAVMRRNPEKVEDYAKRHGIPKFYTNADTLIQDNEIDAVYIATPPDSHKYYAIKVAKSGKPCCIEKPMAPNYTDSLEIYKAFQEKNIPLFIAYYRRSLPRFLKVREWLNSNEIGAVRHIRWLLSRISGQLDMSGAYNWRTDIKVAPGGYFDDLASHGLDLFIFLMGDIKRAHGLSTNQQGFYSAKDAVSGVWLHGSGVTGEGSWNFGCDRREDKVEIYGSKGKISFSVFEEEEIVLENANGIQRIFIENPKHVQQYHVENLAHYFFEEREHPSTGKTALHTSWVMDKILGAH
ncbi:Gfo/Idh/MocA family protein [Maribacter sp. 2304DJ31-5]|uniref:Gfo/Idh/MocA family protein n=1 Tax=Maribacter sp. 2304DJ31-5 TaxID=3386273 RepID=UPI0039BCDFA0